MTTKASKSAARDSQAPYGTEPRRSKGPLIVLGVLYVGWLVVLLWMAAFHTGR
jgi:hypothetical protein